MKNRRAFSRHEKEALVLFRNDEVECLGEIHNLGLGGMRARVPKKQFKAGELIVVGPQDVEPLEYEVCWVKEVGGSFEIGLRYPHSVAGFWESWAADLLANARPTNGEVIERRSQVRLGCTLKATLKVKRKQYSVDVLDVGAGGALIETADKLKEGLSAQMTIKDPVRVGHVPCLIVRAWPGQPHRYGLSFENVRERHKLALIRLLDLLLRRKD